MDEKIREIIHQTIEEFVFLDGCLDLGREGQDHFCEVLTYKIMHEIIKGEK